MTLAQAWMRQAESDYQAAKRVGNPHDPRSWCQAICKYQQSIEKAVKSILDKLHGAGLVRQGSDRSHKVARYAAVLTTFPATSDGRDLLHQLRRLLSPSVVDQIGLLDSLVPEYPARGSFAKRNHEYPFQDGAGDWHAPADEGSFTAVELKRIQSCAGRLIRRLAEILEALELVYP